MNQTGVPDHSPFDGRTRPLAVEQPDQRRDVPERLVDRMMIMIRSAQTLAVCVLVRKRER
jgi:hypothetical protein